MPSENVLQFTEETPATPTPVAGASAPEAEPQSGSPDPDDRPLSVQERRQQVARDINAKIETLETDIGRLTGAFGQSQETVKAAMGELQQRSLEVMADVMRLSTRLDQNTQQLDDQHRALDGRLTRSVSDLGRGLGEAGALMQAQKERLDRLQDSHDALTRLHDHLDRMSTRQAQSLDLLATDTRQQLLILRTQIDGLSALYREQQSDLLALTSDHELLALKSGQLEAHITGLNIMLAESVGETRRRFRTVAAAIVVLAVVCLGLIAYVQRHPLAVPEAVSAQLARLSNGLDLQEDTSEALQIDMAQLQHGLSRQIGELARQFRSQGRDVASLEAEAARTAAALRDLDARVAALQQAQTAASIGSVLPAPETTPAP